MLSQQLVQSLASGITVGAIYALVGLGFSIIYNASHIMNFAQGEFLMLGGMICFSLTTAGVPLPVAILIGVVLTGMAGVALKILVTGRTRQASVVTMVLTTIGASIFMRGVAQLIWGKDYVLPPSFGSDEPVRLGNAAIHPQSLWVVGVTIVLLFLLRTFFLKTLYGKAIRAVAENRLAAHLVGIEIDIVLIVSFGLSGALGALAGILIAPISLTYYNVGVILGLKGFAAAILGGLSSHVGIAIGGLCLGIFEQMFGGFVSSAYKDAAAFIILLLVLFLRPTGLLGGRDAGRV